jgi:hypothetical protein
MMDLKLLQLTQYPNVSVFLKGALQKPTTTHTTTQKQQQQQQQLNNNSEGEINRRKKRGVK